MGNPATTHSKGKGPADDEIEEIAQRKIEAHLIAPDNTHSDAYQNFIDHFAGFPKRSLTSLNSLHLICVYWGL